MMFQVRIRVSDDQARLDERIEAIRVWLDARNCEPTIRCSVMDHSIVCQVAFAAAADAVECISAFDGELICGSPAAV
jgi:hypothetical protein